MYGGDVARAMTNFTEVEPTLEVNPCIDWKWTYDNRQILIILSGALVGIINSICVALFEHIVMFEKCLTIEEEIKQ